MKKCSLVLLVALSITPVAHANLVEFDGTVTEVATEADGLTITVRQPHFAFVDGVWIDRSVFATFLCAEPIAPFGIELGNSGAVWRACSALKEGDSITVRSSLVSPGSELATRGLLPLISLQVDLKSLEAQPSAAVPLGEGRSTEFDKTADHPGA